MFGRISWSCFGVPGSTAVLSYDSGWLAGWFPLLLRQLLVSETAGARTGREGRGCGKL